MAPTGKVYSLEELEKQHIERVLKETKGHRGQTASLLGIDRKTLYQKIKKYRLNKEQEDSP